MTDLLNNAQMRAVEAAAFALGRVSGADLMQRAGAGVVAAIFAKWPDLRTSSQRAVVLCGPGNNGGDGYVVARLLRDWGWQVFVHGIAAGSGDAGKMAQSWGAAGGQVLPLTTEALLASMQGAAVVVDALLGIGQVRSADALLGLVWQARALSGVHRWVAVDVPTGLNADSGRLTGALVCKADLTVTFHRAKLGHHLAQGPEICGQLAVANLRISSGGITGLRLAGPAVGLDKGAGHKFSHGHALILGGSTGQGGAARLAARGALRVGAGLVTLACPANALAENAARLDAVMLRVVEDGAALTAALEDTRISALCLGPGLGLDARAAGLVRAALKAGGKRLLPTVLDADALTLVARDASLFDALHSACVLTPHGGEFARLFPDIVAKLNDESGADPSYSKVDATLAASVRARCVVLFKGADTVIASPDGTCALNAATYDAQAPWLATAGSGDVLAGIITGLLARGFSPQQAAETGAWAHSAAARHFGPGLIAEDLPEQLPAVFRTLGL
jgi:hydroxyethylthiazole kinase-like uncharacterized protein yjeF